MRAIAQLRKRRHPGRHAAGDLRPPPRSAPCAVPPACRAPAGWRAAARPAAAPDAAAAARRAGRSPSAATGWRRSGRSWPARTAGTPRPPPRTAPPFSAAIAGDRSQLTTRMPRPRSSGATTPRPPTSSASAKRRVVSSSRSSSRSAASRSTSATAPTVRAARSRWRRTASRSNTSIESMHRACAPAHGVAKPSAGALPSATTGGSHP